MRYPEEIDKMKNRIEMGVTVCANTVLDNGDGTFTLMLDAAELDRTTHQLIWELLPDLTDGFYALLAKQALLNALAKPGDRDSSKESHEVLPAKSKTAKPARNNSPDAPY